MCNRHMLLILSLLVRVIYIYIIYHIISFNSDFSLIFPCFIFSRYTTVSLFPIWSIIGIKRGILGLRMLSGVEEGQNFCELLLNKKNPYSHRPISLCSIMVQMIICKMFAVDDNPSR